MSAVLESLSNHIIDHQSTPFRFLAIQDLNGIVYLSHLAPVDPVSSESSEYLNKHLMKFNFHEFSRERIIQRFTESQCKRFATDSLSSTLHMIDVIEMKKIQQEDKGFRGAQSVTKSIRILIDIHQPILRKLFRPTNTKSRVGLIVSFFIYLDYYELL